MGRTKKSPKKPTTGRFFKVDIIKTYLYITNMDDLFRLGRSDMKEVEHFDYGLPWTRLKKGEEGDLTVFELCDFEVADDEEKARFIKIQNKIWEENERLIREERKRKAMYNRVRRIIMGSDYRRFYWAPRYMMGHMVLTMLVHHGFGVFGSFNFRFGLFIMSCCSSFIFRFCV